MAYIGKGFKDIATANIAVNTMVGDGSDTTLGLSMGSKGVGSVNDVSVFVGGIQQRPGTDFTLSGSTITFTTAPADGVKVVAMSHGDSWNNAPSDNTVTAAKLKDASVTSDKIIGLDAGKLSGSLSGSGVNLTNLNAANISGTLPAIDGSALTGVSAYENETSDPTATENKTLGTMWVNKTSGEMYILTDDTTNANVWTNVGGGTGDMPFTGMVATGGVVSGGTIDGDYKYHVFNNSSDGPFVVTTAGDTPEVEYLVIAGGGGGGGSISGGGGGAGGYLTATGFSVTASSYPITVGAGGAASTNGANSVFSTITATGGGYGGAYTGAGQAGGSGGGSGGASQQHAGGTGIAGQGFAGGIGDQAPDRVGGGGGGASEVGSAGVATNILGQGGDGLSSSITGSAVIRGGGGTGSGNAGSEVSPVAGGAGGGGSGGNSQTAATTGTANTGGGGGGGTTGAGKAGGSGVVIIRYKFQ